MCSDRELLELAAKAAGLQLCGYSWVGENEDDEEGEVLESAFVKLHPEQELATKWNPLTDDGDALRLAVKLSMSLEKVVSSRGSAWIADHRAEEVVGTDSSAAARRAITRAAAAIGEAM